MSICPSRHLTIDLCISPKLFLQFGWDGKDIILHLHHRHFTLLMPDRSRADWGDFPIDLLLQSFNSDPRYQDVLVPTYFTPLDVHEYIQSLGGNISGREIGRGEKNDNMDVSTEEREDEL